MAEAVPNLTITSTVAITGTKTPVMRQIGSGTLIAVADSRFVLTAAHVVREGARHGYTLGVSGGKSANFIALGGTWMVSVGSHPDATDDKHDVALYELSEDQVARLGDVEFVRIGDASFTRDLSNGYFVVTGFPGMWSTVLDGAGDTMKSKLLQYGTWAFSGSTAALENYDDSHHFLLTASPSEVLDTEGIPVTFRTRQGFAAQMPTDLRGISGCSVWQIGDLTKPVGSWDRGSSRVVGIETGVFPGRGAIKVTRWNAVTTLLYNAFPLLRSAIEMYAH
jgi:hypothetical protein